MKIPSGARISRSLSRECDNDCRSSQPTYAPDMATRSSYLPRYSASRALIIGINKYQHASPLAHARNDAEAVVDVLKSSFAFPAENLDVLLDDSATRQEIMKTFLGYADTSRINVDDRILVVFAGHGHTVSAHRGEIGFLVPVDGNTSDLSTLIRWDDLTRSADLIPAKHMLFVMDACYGGLALTRTAIPPGSMRFLKDMLQRFSRQVLTAGKADEVVADAGGSRSGHSIFTSHLLDGIEGAAIGPSGILTGYGLMAYVYDKVGKDVHSRQTPHFGFFDGDGDFIFDTSHLARLDNTTGADPGVELDELIQSPFISSQQNEDVADTLKRLIPDPSQQINLSDYIFSLIRKAGDQLRKENFPTSGSLTKEEIASRVQRYEDAVADLLVSVVLLSAWGTAEQIDLIAKILEHVSEFEKPQGGVVFWIGLNWYPVLLLMYATGISALATRRFNVLHTALYTEIWLPRPLQHRDHAPLVLPVGWEMTDIVELFKMLPGMERRYYARSDHVHKRLQPILEDQLFLGKSYESLFDTFEIFFALAFADVRDESTGVWGPPGRFMLKERGMLSNERPYTQFIEKAKARGDQWEPLKAGFFQNSSQRFATLADGYARRMSEVNLV